MALHAATEVKPIIPRREHRTLLEYYLLVKKWHQYAAKANMCTHSKG